MSPVATRSCSAVVILAFGLFAATASAEVVLHDTLEDPFSTNFLVGLSSSGSGTINQPADSFIVSGGDFLLDSLTLDLDDSQIVGGPAGGDYAIRIWDNDVDRPGTLLEAFDVPGSDLLNAPITVLSVLNPVLSDGETYWVSAALPDDVSSGLWTAVTTPSNGRAVAFSNAADPNWIATTSTDALALRVTGTLVPEPATTWLVVVGLALSARTRR